MPGRTQRCGAEGTLAPVTAVESARRPLSVARTAWRRSVGRFWLLFAVIVVVAVAAAMPSLARSIASHRGSEPAAAASVDDRREIVVRFTWTPGDDTSYPFLPRADLRYRSATSGPEIVPELVDWPLPDAFAV